MLLAVLLFTFGIANMIASSLWVNPLVLAASVGGRSVLLSVNETNRTHNERRVMESRVLLQREGGTTAETSFLSTSGIFVPSLDVNAPLPRPGVGFRVRHLPNYPDAFLILTDDDSDYLHEMRCGDVGRRAVEARSRADFQRNDAVARAQSEKFAGEWEACRVEHIAAALQLPTKELSGPTKVLLESKQISKKSDHRATTYFARK